MSGIMPVQIRSEIRALLDFLQSRDLRSVLEIGTWYGGTLFLWTRVAAADATLMSIDLPGGPWGGGYHRHRIPLYHAFARGRQTLRLLRSDSGLASSVAWARGHARGEGLDFLFVDGDHSAAAVARDFDSFRPLVREGGFVAFHDIVPGDPALVGQVPEFWAKVKPRFPHIEFVEDWGQGGCGIGVLRL